MSQHGLQSGAGTKTNISIETRSWPRWPVVFRFLIVTDTWAQYWLAAPCRSQPPEYRLSGGSWQCLTNDCVQQDICRHLPRVCRLHSAHCTLHSTLHTVLRWDAAAAGISLVPSGKLVIIYWRDKSYSRGSAESWQTGSQMTPLRHYPDKI